MMVAIIVIVVFVLAFFYVKHLKKSGAIFPKLDPVDISNEPASYTDEEEE